MIKETYLSALKEANTVSEIADILEAFIAQEVADYFFEDAILDRDEIAKLIQKSY